MPKRARDDDQGKAGMQLDTAERIDAAIQLLSTRKSEVEGLAVRGIDDDDAEIAKAASRRAIAAVFGDPSRELTDSYVSFFPQILTFESLSDHEHDEAFRASVPRAVKFLQSLILELQELKTRLRPQTTTPAPVRAESRSNKIFIVHGHDESIKTKAARFLEKLGFEAIILHEQASKGMTIIEKIEAYTDVGFALVLYTGDDKGASNSDAAKGDLASRPRQNVVFEHGYLIAKLGRQHVIPLVADRVELPSDISGVVYLSKSDWQIDIAKELKASGYSIDFNKII